MESDIHINVETLKAATDIVQTDAGKVLFLPATTELGRTLGTITGLANSLLFPLELANWKIKTLRKRLIPEVQRRVAAIPEERRGAPDIAISGPIIESAAYGVHHDELRDLYAALLAHSMDKDTASSVHPAFVEIVRQMTPDEARIISYFSRNPEDSYPAINMKTSILNGKLIARLFSHIGGFSGCEHKEKTPNYLDNLIRLGLLEITSASDHIHHKELEDELRKNFRDGHVSARFDILLTDFGDQFCEICTR